MERVVLVGTSGTGKTRLAGALAETLDAAHLELDAIHHLPGWQPIAEDDVRREVADFVTRHDRWVVDGNYSAVRDPLWSAADTVVWLDLSRPPTMLRVTLRSLRRVLTREVLWNGNRERARSLLAWDPERSIIRWAWTTHGRRRREMPDHLAGPRWHPLVTHRLVTPAEVADRAVGVGPLIRRSRFRGGRTSQGYGRADATRKSRRWHGSTIRSRRRG